MLDNRYTFDYNIRTYEVFYEKPSITAAALLLGCRREAVFS